MQSITCQILTLRGPTMKQLASLYLSYFLDHRESPYLVTILIFRECKGSLRFFYPEIIIFGGLCVLTHWQSHLSPLSLSLPLLFFILLPLFFHLKIYSSQYFCLFAGSPFSLKRHNRTV